MILSRATVPMYSTVQYSTVQFSKTGLANAEECSYRSRQQTSLDCFILLDPYDINHHLIFFCIHVMSCHVVAMQSYILYVYCMSC
jgi:hypothetical protein